MVAAINLLMSRIASTVKTFGLTAVIAGQLPLTLILIHHVSLALYLFGLVVQVVITVLWTNLSTRLLKITGGNVTKAARLAGRNRTEFYRLLERHSLEPGMFKAA